MTVGRCRAGRQFAGHGGEWIRISRSAITAGIASFAAGIAGGLRFGRPQHGMC